MAFEETARGKMVRKDGRETMDLKRELLNEESPYEIVLWRRGIRRVIECRIG
jgi:hypothetical protein